MLLKLSGQGAVYIRSNVKLASGSDSDHSDNDDFLEPSIAAVKQDPEILEIPSESDIEDAVMIEQAVGIAQSVPESAGVHAHIVDEQTQTNEPFPESTPLIDIFDEQNHDNGFDGSAEKGEGVCVARDVLASFWQVFVDSLAVGVQEKVPSIRHDHQKMQWVAIVSILIYGYLREKYFPISLSLVKKESLTNHDLLQSFRMYISDDERETFDKCCNGELSPDDEEVLELLSSYKCHRIPNAENIRLIFSELAHQELIQKPKYVVHCWAPHIQTLKSFPPFQSTEVLKEMYDEKRPSSRKVIKLLNFVPTNYAENQCLDHLKRYIKSLQGQSLTRFLQFTTGSDIIVTEQIKVNFVAAQGFARRPIAHTCAPLLELPSTYQCYNDLAEEFSNILADKLSWAFDIV
ncbi:Werner syndrome ATP-dependent helicase-like 1 [Paramuricea clavata]|uniref:Werner syndrome ATP-dependent helicase-like 1 n=1 Tax=Paramuricea clavata TaxID=317549 RepID=A0A7D9DQA8_PARCT|nr:Werner syndrome ATP-dependent helicase-like 1 [Paramuricea clavata]